MSSTKSTIEFIGKRIEFFYNYDKVIRRNSKFKCMRQLFKKLEADYDKGIVPSDDEKVYVFSKKSKDHTHVVPIKLGKFLKRNYPTLVPKDHILTEFVACLNAQVWKEPPKINIYTGVDIIEAYMSLKGRNGLETCMVNLDAPESILKIYAVNTDKVQLYCLEDHENIKARVLVWTLDNGSKVVDRIYPNTGENFQKLKEYFRTRKEFHLRSNHSIVDSTDQYTKITGLEKVIIELDVTDIDEYPYFDTFHYGMRVDNTLYISNGMQIDYDMRFDGENGDYTDLNEEDNQNNDPFSPNWF